MAIDPLTGEETMEQPSITAPSAFGSGTSGLAPDVKLEVRQVKGAEMPGFQAAPDDIVSTTPVSAKESTSARVREQAGPTSFGYVGQNLVDERGVIVRGQYDASKEAYSELARMNTNERIGFQQSLASRGLYPKNYRPSGSFESADLTAMTSFLRFANFSGVTVKVALPLFQSQVKASGGIGKVVRPDAAQDLDYAVNRVFREFLVRDATPEELQAFRGLAYKRKVTEATGGARAPDVSVAAQAYASNQFGPEAQATSALSLFDIMDKKIKGLA